MRDDTWLAAMVAIILGLAVALTTVLVFGIGWANRGVSDARAQVEVHRLTACETLPSPTERQTCINPPLTPQQQRQQAVGTCNNSVLNANDAGAPVPDWQQCMEDLTGGKR